MPFKKIKLTFPQIFCIPIKVHSGEMEIARTKCLNVVKLSSMYNAQTGHIKI